MVRILVGTLLQVNEGRLPESSLYEVLASCDRHRAGKTAPPQGHLNQVVYPRSVFEEENERAFCLGNRLLKRINDVFKPFCFRLSFVAGFFDNSPFFTMALCFTNPLWRRFLKIAQSTNKTIDPANDIESYRKKEAQKVPDPAELLRCIALALIGGIALFAIRFDVSDISELLSQNTTVQNGSSGYPPEAVWAHLAV